MLLLNRNWNETRHFQVSPPTPAFPRATEPCTTPGPPRLPRPQPPGKGFTFSSTTAPFPKSSLRKRIVCMLLNHLTDSKMVAGKERTEEQCFEANPHSSPHFVFQRKRKLLFPDLNGRVQS